MTLKTMKNRPFELYLMPHRIPPRTLLRQTIINSTYIKKQRNFTSIS